MVVLSKFSVVKTCKPPALFPAAAVPLIDLSKPDSKHLLVKACEEFGFFKVVNHGVPSDFIATLESEALRFFSSPLSEKLKAGPPDPFGYGNKNVGACGDIGWVEYILLSTRHPQLNFQKFSSIMGLSPENFRTAVNEYVTAVKRMACEILELLADGLTIHPRNVFSKLLMDEQSDSVFRLNHYPPCPELGKNPIGFGEHTDPQIISVLRSNNTSGLQIALNDGSWMSVPPDQHSFFINVGDSLQVKSNMVYLDDCWTETNKDQVQNNVTKRLWAELDKAQVLLSVRVKFSNMTRKLLSKVMTNGRFKSVRHRVLSNSAKSRLSMIYFGGPPLKEKIAPLPSLMEADQDSLYREFTWFEFKKSAFSSRLAVNRLVPFEKIAAS